MKILTGVLIPSAGGIIIDKRRKDKRRLARLNTNIKWS